VRVLLLEDSAAESDRLLVWLAPGFVVTHVTTVGEAAAALGGGGFDVALVDLCVADSRGLPTFLRCHAAAPHVPFVVQSGIEGDAVALEAVARGAQDYLVKRHLTRDLVHRALRYAIERGRIQRELEASRERYQLALDGSNDGIWDWSIVTGAVFLSERAVRMFGYAPGEIGPELEDWLALLHPEDRDGVVAALAHHVEGRTDHLEIEHRVLRRDGEWRWVLTRGLAVRGADGAPVRMAGSHSDVTERRAYEARLVHQARHDALTDLPNRALFLERLGLAIERCRSGATGPCAVLFLDLDRFKVVNDSLGHLSGDRLLVAVAQRLRASVRPGDLVARLGGDEFALLLENLERPRRADDVAARIHHAMAAPFILGESQIFATASIGIVRYAGQACEPDVILRNADIAMYRSKRAGRATTEVFDDAHYVAATVRLELENGLRRALDGDELVLQYQPIVRLADGGLVGFEALVRWQQPGGRMVPPSEFIPIAEETGLINAMGTWVLRRACLQMAELSRNVPPAERLSVSVNVSTRQFAQPQFARIVQECLAESGLDPAQLILEITETALMESPVTAADVLTRLRRRGVRIHLDDFGVGYSALSYLRRFPIDCLKIDRSFVQAVPGRPEDDAIVIAIIGLATAFGLDVVAEGVETEQQWGHMQQLACAYGQGFYFSEPVDEGAMAQVVRGHALRGTGLAPAIVAPRRLAGVGARSAR
jgi:diguanylate cyclase (GGDEF)-like protein/PAS domain S-box-containing protein